MILRRRFSVKNILFLVLVTGQCCSDPVFSQQDKAVEVEGGLHAGYFVNLSFDDAGWGFGGSAKLLFPIERNGNFITAGLIADRMKESGDIGPFRTKAPVYTMFNTVGGYRKMFRNFFIEPQAGIGIFHERDEEITYTYDINGNITGIYEVDDRSRTVLNVFPGIESGFLLNKLTCSFLARFNYADPFKEFVYAVFSLKAAYRFGVRSN